MCLCLVNGETMGTMVISAVFAVDSVAKMLMRRCGRSRQRAADAVEHLAAHLVRGVYVAVDIDLDGRVQRDDAETADDLRMVGYLLRADDHLVAVLVDILEEAFAAVGGKRDGACGDKVNNALVDEREGRVLHDPSVYIVSPFEAGCRQNAQNSVA